MDVDDGRTLLARFFTPEGESMGPPMNVPANINIEQLSVLLNDHVLKNVRTFVHLFRLSSPTELALEDICCSSAFLMKSDLEPSIPIPP